MKTNVSEKMELLANRGRNSEGKWLPGYEQMLRKFERRLQRPLHATIVAFDQSRVVGQENRFSRTAYRQLGVLTRMLKTELATLMVEVEIGKTEKCLEEAGNDGTLSLMKIGEIEEHITQILDKLNAQQPGVNFCPKEPFARVKEHMDRLLKERLNTVRMTEQLKPLLVECIVEAKIGILTTEMEVKIVDIVNGWVRRASSANGTIEHTMGQLELLLEGGDKRDTDRIAVTNELQKMEMLLKDMEMDKREADRRAVTNERQKVEMLLKKMDMDKREADRSAVTNERQQMRQLVSKLMRSYEGTFAGVLLNGVGTEDALADKWNGLLTLSDIFRNEYYDIRATNAMCGSNCPFNVK